MKVQSINAIAKQIVDCAFRVHVALGPGLFESIYLAALTSELQKRNLNILVQHGIPATYDGTELGIGFRADLIVQDEVIVEVKSVECLAPVHKRQLLTYLRLANKRLGLLINFNVPLIKDGITRIANNLY